MHAEISLPGCRRDGKVLERPGVDEQDCIQDGCPEAGPGEASTGKEGCAGKHYRSCQIRSSVLPLWPASHLLASDLQILPAHSMATKLQGDGKPHRHCPPIGCCPSSYKNIHTVLSLFGENGESPTCLLSVKQIKNGRFLRRACPRSPYL